MICAECKWFGERDVMEGMETETVIMQGYCHFNPKLECREPNCIACQHIEHRGKTPHS
jgi:hypothetical protein